MKKIISSILFILGSFLVFGQVPKDEVKVDTSVFPQESVMLYTNSGILLAGEPLQYKIDVLNDRNRKSTLSQIAYVSLRNQNDSLIFNHKLKLKEGSSYSDFFLPANLKTGIYTLVGFTNFSRNKAVDPLYEKKIYVINTFLKNNVSSTTNDTTKINATAQKPTSFLNSKADKQSINIKTDKNSYGFRKKVSVIVDPITESHGEYLLSVRQINPTEISDYNSQNTRSGNSTGFFIPELRGEIVSGVVLSTDDAKPIVNIKVSLTIPGSNFIFKLSKTNENGRFFFSIPEDYHQEKCIIQVVGAKEELQNFKLVLDQKNLNLETSETTHIKIDPQLKTWLQERSVQLQIENAYFEKKQDSLFSRKSHASFYDGLGTLFVLDDYSRFPTVRETFIEIITPAAIRGSGATTKFLVYNEYDPRGLGKFNNIPPLVLMDGTMIQDNSELINYNARDIKSIRVINLPYRYGPMLFSGIISVETINGNFMPQEHNYLKMISLPPTVQGKKYFQPNYSDGVSSRIPDFRVQLLWNPSVSITEEEYNTHFYTSDVPGIYEIKLTGFSNTGDRIELKNYFKVGEEL